MLIQLLTYSA